MPGERLEKNTGIAFKKMGAPRAGGAHHHVFVEDRPIAIGQAPDVGLAQATMPQVDLRYPMTPGNLSLGCAVIGEVDVAYHLTPADGS